jgi:hypothetical protein
LELRQKAESVRAELAELVHRSLLQLGDMTAMQERLKLVSERISKVVWPPKKPDSGKPDSAT